MATVMKQTRGHSLALAETNPVLAEGQMCVETDTNKFKFGDGESHYNDLPYAGGGTGADTTAIETELADLTARVDQILIQQADGCGIALTQAGLSYGVWAHLDKDGAVIADSEEASQGYSIGIELTQTGGGYGEWETIEELDQDESEAATTAAIAALVARVDAMETDSAAKDVTIAELKAALEASASGDGCGIALTRTGLSYGVWVHLDKDGNIIPDSVEVIEPETSGISLTATGGGYGTWQAA